MLSFLLVAIPGPPDHAWWLRDATLVDGTGGPPVRTDLRLRDGRIVEIGSLAAREDDPENVRDLNGALVTPGAIDLAYPDASGILLRPDVLPALRQGVTTVVIGGDGTVKGSLAEFKKSIRARPAAVDVVPGTFETIDGPEGKGAFGKSGGRKLWRLREWREIGPVLETLRTESKVRPVVGLSPILTTRYAWPVDGLSKWGEAHGGLDRVTIDRYPTEAAREGRSAIGAEEPDERSRRGARIVRTERAGELDRLFASPLVVPIGAGDGFPDHPGTGSAFDRFHARTEIPLPERVRRVTSWPASLLGWRGVAEVGEPASLVVRDQGGKVRDVWVNGRLTLESGRPTGRRFGAWREPAVD